MKKTISNLFLVAIALFAVVACNNQERKVNKEGVDSDQIIVESAILDEYGKLMPQCKNLVSVDVKDIDIMEALVYLDEDKGDAYIESAGVGLVPYEGGGSVSMIVSFEEEGGTKDFEVAEELPEPYVRFYNAETFDILDYEIENIATVIVELVADDTFAELFPEDANYYITDYTAKLLRGDEEVKAIAFDDDGETNKIDLSVLQEGAQVGDQIVVSILGIERMDFDYMYHDLEVPESMKEITLTIK
jgi:hypothetical protein